MNGEVMKSRFYLFSAVWQAIVVLPFLMTIYYTKFFTKTADRNIEILVQVSFPTRRQKKCCNFSLAAA
jgi:hypothetical protein